MEFDGIDGIDDVANGLNNLVTAVDELRDNPPPSLKPETLEALRQVLVDAVRLVAELEEQSEASGAERRR